MDQFRSFFRSRLSLLGTFSGWLNEGYEPKLARSLAEKRGCRHGHHPATEWPGNGVGGVGPPNGSASSDSESEEGVGFRKEFDGRAEKK